jgi:hypothetical protein
MPVQLQDVLPPARDLPDEPLGAVHWDDPLPLVAVVLPDSRTAFSLVEHRGGDPVGVVTCRVVAPVEVVDAVVGWAVGTA